MILTFTEKDRQTERVMTSTKKDQSLQEAVQSKKVLLMDIFSDYARDVTLQFFMKQGFAEAQI